MKGAIALLSVKTISAPNKKATINIYSPVIIFTTALLLAILLTASVVRFNPLLGKNMVALTDSLIINPIKISYCAFFKDILCEDPAKWTNFAVQKIDKNTLSSYIANNQNNLERIKENSRNNIKDYDSCVQSILFEFMKELNIDDPLLKHATGGLHGGLMTSLTCGVHIAGVMILGLFIGRDDIKQGLDGLIPIINPTHELLNRLNSKLGSHSCKELTGVDFTDLNKALEFYNSPERESYQRSPNPGSVGGEDKTVTLVSPPAASAHTPKPLLSHVKTLPDN